MLNDNSLAILRKTVEEFTQEVQKTIKQLERATTERDQALNDNLNLKRAMEEQRARIAELEPQRYSLEDSLRITNAALALSNTKRDDALRRLETSIHTNNKLRVQLRDEQVDNEHLRSVCSSTGDPLRGRAELTAQVDAAANRQAVTVRQRDEAVKDLAVSVKREAQFYAALQETVKDRDLLRERLKSIAATALDTPNPAPIMYGYTDCTDQPTKDF
jgi:chromosome segregation ATPase